MARRAAGTHADAELVWVGVIPRAAEELYGRAHNALPVKTQRLLVATGVSGTIEVELCEAASDAATRRDAA